ncbi:MAG: hypothetical protein JXX14_02570 [Deltaproteobacteria bacterium]|nr:hypothetical protein [Deltaproteobacteria bacterium]
MYYEFPVDGLGWIEQLFPIKAAVVVGAGNGSEPWYRVLNKYDDVPMLFIDAEVSRLQHLERTVGSAENRVFMQATVAPVAGKARFFNVANSSESALIEPKRLKGLWPNIQLRFESEVEAITVASLMKEHCNGTNWLVVDCLPGIELMSESESELEQLDVVILRVVLDERVPSLTELSRVKVGQLMNDKGFMCVGCSAERHPGLGHGVYVRDYSRYASRLEKRIETLVDEKERLHAEFRALAPNLQALEKTVLEQKEAVDVLFQMNEKIANAQSGRIDAVAMEQPDVRSVVGGYTHLEMKLISLAMQLGSELSKMRTLILDSNRAQTETLLQQLESYMGIQYFLKEGRFLPDMHVWPVSPDIALWVMELVAHNDYDLILEFGSGTSTALMAETRQVAMEKGLLKRASVQVAFEHLERYHDKTARILEQLGVRNQVQLELVPLQPYRASTGNEYQYYSCLEKLSELKKQFATNDLKILMLVDGPPGGTGKHARYPALPVVLNEFSGAGIDLVLDDYRRTDEKEIAELWQSDLDKLGLEYELIYRKMEKGACLFKIRNHTN